MEKHVDWQKYSIVFIITAFIFFTALLVSNKLNDKRVEELRSIEGRIAINLLSSETQFALLQETQCIDVNTSILSEELGTLGSRLEYMEEKLSPDAPELIDLKKYYSLLEIKDFLLTKRLTEKCNIHSAVVLYFYSNIGDCKECEEMGSVLTYIRERYPLLRVYSFDSNLNLSAIPTLTSIYSIDTDKLPAVVIDGKLYYGAMTPDEIEKLLPDEIKTASTTEAVTGKKSK